MKNSKVTPKTDRKKILEEKSTSGKKLVQARLPFKILPQSPKPVKTSTDTIAFKSIRNQSIEAIPNTEIRKRKLSYSSDNDTAITKILKTDSKENLNEKIISNEVVISSDDDSNDSSVISNTFNLKEDTDKQKLNNKLIIKLPICSKKKRKKFRESAHTTSDNIESEESIELFENENPTKKIKSTEINKESTNVKIETEQISGTNLNGLANKLNEQLASLSDKTNFSNKTSLSTEELKHVDDFPAENSDQIGESIPNGQKNIANEDVFTKINENTYTENQIIEENDLSINVTNDNSLSTPKMSDKKSVKKSEKQLEKELQKQKEKDEKERQKRLEREEKEESRRKEKEEKEVQRKRERDEKEELKRKEKEEKEKKRLAEIELRNEEKRIKEDERKKKEEERKKREDDKRKKEIEKEEAENKKKKAAEAFTKFFLQSNPKPNGEEEQNSLDSYNSEYRAFMPFEVKGDMTLAPTVRKNISHEKMKNLDNFLSHNNEVENDLYLSALKSSNYKPGSSSKTLTKNIAESDDIVILDNELQDGGQPIDDTTKSRVRYRAKYILFHENRRPPYYGTWRKKSSMITPRKPLAMDKVLFDYEIDSDDEWEEEEAGESLRGSDDEKESEDEYEVDNDFFVPHGHLSDEELLNDDEVEDTNAPQIQKAKLKILQQEFAQEMKKKTEKIKPKLYGIFWADENGNQPESCPDIIWNSLNKRSMLLTEPFLIKYDTFDEAGTSPKQSEKKIKKNEFPEEFIVELIKLTHGNRNKKKFIINEFLAHIKQNMQTNEEQKTIIEYTKKSIQDKIDEIASWKAYLDESQSKKKTLCWIVNPEILGKHDLTNLSIVNDWSYILRPKLKKVLVNKTSESESTSKILANTFEDAAINFTDIASKTDEKNVSKSSHLVKKRVQLISTPLNRSFSSEQKSLFFSNLKKEADISKSFNTIESETNKEKNQDKIIID